MKSIERNLFLTFNYSYDVWYLHMKPLIFPRIMYYMNESIFFQYSYICFEHDVISRNVKLYPKIKLNK